MVESEADPAEASRASECSRHPRHDKIRREAGDLAERYHLRGFDSIHLASFPEMLRGLQGRDDVEFSSFDEHLNGAARRLAKSIR